MFLKLIKSVNRSKNKLKSYPKEKSAKLTHKGTEPSPSGLGIHARQMKLGSISRGKDGTKLIVKKTANGVRRWVRVKKTSAPGGA